jgi:hypothetical protein
MSHFRFYFSLLLLAVTGCATIRESSPPKPTANVEQAISASTALPSAEFLPDQSAIAPGTKYVVVQVGGGSIFLGPILGSLNITATTREMAEKYKNSIFSVDPTPVALDEMAKAGVNITSEARLFTVKPFVFAQHCYDEKFRLSLVFHVDGAEQSGHWVGRYTYHLPTSYDVPRFNEAGADEIANYRAELAQGARILTDLMKRDLAGELASTGKPVSFGTLHIIGNKLGGMGIYTMPEKLFFRNAQVIEETATYVTVRLKGNMSGTLMAGGLAFGVHRIDKKLVHTLKPAETP